MKKIWSLAWWITLLVAGNIVSAETYKQDNNLKFSQTLAPSLHQKKTQDRVNHILIEPSFVFDALSRDIIQNTPSNIPDPSLSWRDYETALHTSENTPLQVMNNMKIAINGLLVMPLWESKLSLVKNGIDIELPWNYFWNSENISPYNAISKPQNSKTYLELTRGHLYIKEVLDNGSVLKFQTGKGHTQILYNQSF